MRPPLLRAKEKSMRWTAWHLHPSAQCVQHGRGRRRAWFRGRGTVRLSFLWRRGRFRGLFSSPLRIRHNPSQRRDPWKMQYRASSPLLSVDLQDACKSAAENLNIPWPTVVAETAKSRYKGKRLPRAKRAARQLLPVFPGGACSDLEGQTIHQQVTRAGRIRSRCGGNGEGRTSPNAPHGAISCRAFAAKAHGGCKSDVAIQSVPFPVKHDGTRL